MSELEIPEIEGLEEHDELIVLLDAAFDLDSRTQLEAALAWKAYALWKAGRSDESVLVWDELARRFESAEEPSLQLAAKIALREEGVILMELRRRGDALGAYRRLMALYFPDRRPWLRNALAAAICCSVWLSLTLRLQRPARRLVREQLRKEQSDIAS